MPQVKNTNGSIAVYSAKILFAILILLVFFTTYLVILGRDSQSYDGSTRRLRATPNSTSFFLSNHYQAGAERFEIEGENGTFLGTDRGASVLAVNMRYREDGSDTSTDLLQVFDARTKERRHEVAGAGCSNVSANNLVYCYNSEDAAINGINVRNGKTFATLPIHGTEKSEASHDDVTAKARLLGSQQQADLVQITTTKEATAEENVVYKLAGEEVRWSLELEPNEHCNLIDRNRTIVCQQPGGDAETKIRTVNVADGSEIAHRNTEAEIALTSDGWMEKSPEADSNTTTAALTSHVSLNQSDAQPTPEPNKIFGINAQEKGTSQNWGGTVFFPRTLDEDADNTETLAYPSHVIEALNYHPGGIVSADGEINLVRVPSHNPSDSSYARAGSPEIVFSISAADQVLTSSKNGKLVLLKLDNSANKLHDVYTIYDTETRASVLDTEDNGNDTITVINGLLAQTKKTQATGGFEKLVIFLPTAT